MDNYYDKYGKPKYVIPEQTTHELAKAILVRLNGGWYYEANVLREKEHEPRDIADIKDEILKRASTLEYEYSKLAQPDFKSWLGKKRYSPDVCLLNLLVDFVGEGFVRQEFILPARQLINNATLLATSMYLEEIS